MSIRVLPICHRVLPIWLLVAVALACSEPVAESTADSAEAPDSASDSGTPPGSDAQANLDISADAGGPIPFWMPPPGGYTVLFIDVGQGDATVLVADDGSTMLIDGGRTTKVLAARLAELKLKQIDIMVATHADSDHIGGLQAAFDEFDVLNVYYNGGTKDTNIFDNFILAAKEEGAQLLVPKRGDVIKLGKLAVEVVHPAKLSGDHNNDSIVLLTGCSGAWVLLTGDAEEPAEKEMLADFGISDIDVLKVGHHGSKSSTTQKFIDALKPKDAVISAGRTNIYGHPDKGVVERLKAAGAKILKTDIDKEDDTLMLKSDCKTQYLFSRPFW